MTILGSLAIKGIFKPSGHWKCIFQHVRLIGDQSVSEGIVEII